MFFTEYSEKYDPGGMNVRVSPEKGDGILIVAPSMTWQWTASSWKHHLSNSIFFACSQLYDIVDNGRGYYCVGWMVFDLKYSTKDIRISSPNFDSASDDRFLFKLSDTYLEIFCHDTIEQCNRWIGENNSRDFMVSFGGAVVTHASLRCPTCPHCAGIHWDVCEVIAASADVLPHDIALESPQMEPLYAEKVFSPRLSAKTIRRDRLVSSIINRAINENVVLVSHSLSFRIL